MHIRTLFALLLTITIGAIAATAQPNTADDVEFRECDWGLLLIASSEPPVPPALLTIIASSTPVAPDMAVTLIAPVAPTVESITPEATESPLAPRATIIAVDDWRIRGAARLLRVESYDLLLHTTDPCTAAADEFSTEVVTYASVTAVSLLEDTLTIYGQGPSRCLLKLRLRFIQTANTYTGDLYYAGTDRGALCTLDLKPFSLNVPLDRRPDSVISVTVNGAAAVLP